MRALIIAPLVGMGLIVAAAIGWLVVDTLLAQLDYRVQADQAAAYYADRAQHQISSTCISPMQVQWDRVCIDVANDTAQENQRAEYDLYAQHTMALWTRVMGWMSVVGIGLTAVGIWFIKMTLDATKTAAISSANATNIMQRAYLAENRPWLKVEWKLAAPMKITGNSAKLILGRTTQNTGKQPAEAARYKYCIGFDVENVDQNLLELASSEKLAWTNARRASGRIIFPSDIDANPKVEVSDSIPTDMRGRDVTVTFYGCVTYASSILEGSLFQTLFSCKIEPHASQSRRVAIPDSDKAISIKLRNPRLATLSDKQQENE